MGRGEVEKSFCRRKVKWFDYGHMDINDTIVRVKQRLNNTIAPKILNTTYASWGYMGQKLFSYTYK